jgi:A/G-specific adenine glycosylase
MPMRRRVAELPELATVALWAERRAKILVAQRPASGLYGGLWELPQGADATAAAHAVGLRLLTAPRPLGEHRQTLSHRRLYIQLVQAGVGGKATVTAPTREIYQALRWISVGELNTLGVSSATVALVQLATIAGATSPDLASGSVRDKAPHGS